MPLPTVVIAQHDQSIAKGLADELDLHFARVVVAESAEELPTLLQRHQARVAVLDTEIVNLNEVRQLAHSFDDLAIVCTHSSPDEKMWMAALTAGAVEFCHPGDLRSILRASSGVAKRRTDHTVGTHESIS
jgi:DNA-binding NarL/FixJ family response regulator